ncbi:hypothetical protein GP475_08680 [Corynebacterium poyangense]|uniref:Uncharacterized protein n=1 Tax=Corynebacterium poyangense TaxID=2684405 RepID=A0A7H0SQ78_9CORY|nr:hypothetical protein [Corynebacterium poyangense]QNQ90703.1 hypothetical protein GP475_08680 [Corynebacterium poyangense]
MALAKLSQIRKTEQGYIFTATFTDEFASNEEYTVTYHTDEDGAGLWVEYQEHVSNDPETGLAQYATGLRQILGATQFDLTVSDKRGTVLAYLLADDLGFESFLTSEGRSASKAAAKEYAKHQGI